MEVLPVLPCLELPPGTLQDIRKLYHYNSPLAINEAIDLLEGWIKKQNHFLKKDFSREFLERAIITSKGSVERAKSRLDKLCTYKITMPHFFEEFDVRKDFKTLFSIMRLVILPKFAPDYYRVFVEQCVSTKHNSALFPDSYKFSRILCDYWMAYDYLSGFIIVLDYRKLNMTEVVSSLNLMELRQVLAMYLDAYGVRMKGMHIITESKIVEVLVKLLKQVVSSKIGNRVHVHTTIKDVYDYVPRDILPQEFGGDEKSMDDLQEEWLSVLESEEHTVRMNEIKQAGINKSYRPKDKISEDYMGMPGTFRALNVD